MPDSPIENEYVEANRETRSLIDELANECRGDMLNRYVAGNITQADVDALIYAAARLREAIAAVKYPTAGPSGTGQIKRYGA